MTLSLKSFHVTFHHGAHIIIIEDVKYHLHSIGGALVAIIICYMRFLYLPYDIFIDGRLDLIVWSLIIYSLWLSFSQWHYGNILTLKPQQKYHSMIFVHTVFLFHIRSIIDNEVKRFLIICNNFLMIQFDLPNKVRISYDFHLSFNYRSIVILSYTLIYNLRFMGSNENKLHRLNHTGLSVHLEKWK